MEEVCFKRAEFWRKQILEATFTYFPDLFRMVTCEKAFEGTIGRPFITEGFLFLSVRWSVRRVRVRFVG